MNRNFAIVAALSGLLGFAVAFSLLSMRWTPLVEALQQQRVEAAPPPVVVAKNWDFWTLEIGALSEELLKERQALRSRTKDLDTWQKQLETEKGELVRVREQIEAIRDEINKSVVTLMEAEKPNLKALSKSYSIMKPPQAVAIFRKTNDDIVVKILSLMKPDMVAAILAQMSADTPEAKGPAAKGQPDTKGSSEETTGNARAARITEMLRLLKQETAKKETP